MSATHLPATRHLPDLSGTPSRPRRPDHVRAVPGPPSATSVLVQLTAPTDRQSLDLPGIANAVERLVRSLAPDVVTRVSVGAPAPAAPPPGTGCGERDADFWLDVERRTLTIDGDRRSLTRREFDLLAYLVRRRGVAVTRRELMARVWGSRYGVGDRTIDVHVRRLRVKLGRHEARITTLRGYGYRFD